MKIVCLDVEGVLLPELWLQIGEEFNLPNFHLTTQDFESYDELMNFRLETLKNNKLLFSDVQSFLQTIEPLKGACKFIQEIHDLGLDLVLISDSYYEFLNIFRKKINFSVVLCHHLLQDSSGYICSWKRTRQKSKGEVVNMLKEIGYQVFSAGDSFNDISMLQNSHQSVLFRAPKHIVSQYPNLNTSKKYDELLELMGVFVNK